MRIKLFFCLSIFFYLNTLFSQIHIVKGQSINEIKIGDPIEVVNKKLQVFQSLLKQELDYNSDKKFYDIIDFDVMHFYKKNKYNISNITSNNGKVSSICVSINDADLLTSSFELEGVRIALSDLEDVDYRIDKKYVRFSSSKYKNLNFSNFYRKGITLVTEGRKIMQVHVYKPITYKIKEFNYIKTKKKKYDNFELDFKPGIYVNYYNEDSLIREKELPMYNFLYPNGKAQFICPSFDFSLLAGFEVFKWNVVGDIFRIQMFRSMYLDIDLEGKPTEINKGDDFKHPWKIADLRESGRSVSEFKIEKYKDGYFKLYRIREIDENGKVKDFKINEEYSEFQLFKRVGDNY